MRKALDNLGTRSALWLVIAIGVVVRLVLALVTRGHTMDLIIFGKWAEALRYHRTDEFYYVAENPDHLPGDLWFHFLVSHVYQAFYNGQDFWNWQYRFLVRVVPTVADVAIAFCLFAILRRVVSERASLMTVALFFLNPATIFLSGMWGQWDSVSMAFLVGGLAVVAVRPERWLWAVPLIAWATVIKPNLALPGGLILLFTLVIAVRDSTSIFGGLKRTVLPAAAAAIGGVLTILLICVPFSVGLPGMATNWTIFERANFALDYYPYKVLGAANLWMVEVGSFEHVDDRQPILGGLDAHGIGNVFLGTSGVIVGLAFIYFIWGPLRDNPLLAVTWSAAAITFATYVLPTRVHERYLFPAFVFIILLIGLTETSRRTLIYLTFLSANFLANLIFVYYNFHEGFTEAYGEGVFTVLLRLTSFINIVAFVALIVEPKRWLGRPESTHRPLRIVRRFRDAPSL